MRKKTLLIFLTIIAVVIGITGMSAFEAHIINVTAQIENALSIDPSSLDFGNVFPQESFDEFVNIGLSDSFLAQDRVNTVDYILRQKPKCYSESEQSFGLVTENELGEFVCADGGDYEILPLLCPYLSKEEITDDGETENDAERLNAFHGDLLDWDMEDTISTERYGQLVNASDIADEWHIDLKAPCFEGECAQDWPDYVLAANAEADPFAYILPKGLSGELFGCDLWFELTGINEYGQKPVSTVCQDLDADGYGVKEARDNCIYPELDCDDGASDVNPAATEICDDTIDNDCDGDSDCDDSDCDADSACSSPVASEPGFGDVLINEIAWMGTEIGSSDEWIELYNPTASAIDLTGWLLADIDGTPSIALSGFIPADGYYLMERTDDTSVPGATADLIYTGGLNNSSEYLNLIGPSPDHTIIDYADGDPDWPAGDSATHRTMERCSDGSWHSSLAIEGSPRSENSPCENAIMFSDVGADPQYGYIHDYSAATVSFTYDTVADDILSGIITGSGLKPYATYQLKFEGNPTCATGIDSSDNEENDAIGYKGRWWDDTTTQNLNSSPANNDQFILDHPTHCYIGYLVWDFVTADSDGNISKSVASDKSFHVLRCDDNYSCGGPSSDADLYNPDVAHPAVDFCAPADVYGEMERSCGSQALDAGNYTLKMVLEEESFHQGPWTYVMDSPIEFGIY